MNAYKPSSVSPPGWTIMDVLFAQPGGADAFVYAASAATDIGTKKALGLIDGSTEITPEIAEFLGEFIGPDADFWLRREKTYRESLNG